jgi:hypothetical protein
MHVAWGCDQANDACPRPDSFGISNDSEGGGDMIPPTGAAPAWRVVALWVVVAVAGAVLTVLAFRAYLNPSAIIDFANSRLC